MKGNPNWVKGHPKIGGKVKGSKSSYTIADVMERLAKVEKSISEASGKPYDFIEHCIQDGIKGDRTMRLAILDRVCPIPKDDTKPTTIIINNQIP